MPRAFREGDYDKKVTKLLRSNGLFRDRRSKVVHSLDFELHLLLFGEDMSDQRRRVFLKKQAPDWYELDHIVSGLSGRCDCTHNLEPLCPREHQAKHNRIIKSGKEEDAHGSE